MACSLARLCRTAAITNSNPLSWRGLWAIPPEHAILAPVMFSIQVAVAIIDLPCYFAEVICIQPAVFPSLSYLLLLLPLLILSSADTDIAGPS